MEAVVDNPEEPVEEVRLAYRSPSGKTLYRTYRVVDAAAPAPDSSGAGYAESESIERMATDHTEPELEESASMDRTEGAFASNATAYEYKELGQTSVEDEPRPSGVSSAHRQDDTLVGQISGKVRPVADDQVSLYSFL